MMQRHAAECPCSGHLIGYNDNKLWKRLVNIVGVIPIPGISGSNVCHGVHAMGSLIEGDNVARFIGAVERTCSFDAETPVATAEGATPISEIDVGDRVLAWDETTNATGYYTVTATLAHVDPVIVHLTIDGETIETTPEHPFYAVASAP